MLPVLLIPEPNRPAEFSVTVTWEASSCRAKLFLKRSALEYSGPRQDGA